jgi:hypothetical protein
MAPYTSWSAPTANDEALFSNESQKESVWSTLSSQHTHLLMSGNLESAECEASIIPLAQSNDVFFGRNQKKRRGHFVVAKTCANSGTSYT